MFLPYSYKKCQANFTLAEAFRSFAPGILLQYLYFEIHGLSAKEAGLILLISSITSLISSPLLGTLGGQLGYSKMLRSGYLMSSAGALTLALANHAQMPPILLGFCMLAIGRSSIASNLPNSLYKESQNNPSRPAHLHYLNNAARVFSASRLSYIAAAALGGWCYSKGAEIPFYLQSFSALLAAAIITCAPAHTKKKTCDEAETKPCIYKLKKTLIKTLLSYGLCSISGSIIFIYMGIAIVRDRGFQASTVSIIMVIALITESTLVQFSASAYKQRVTRLLAAPTLIITGCLLSIYASGILLIGIGLGACFAGFMLANKYAFLQIRHEVHDSQAGFVFGLFSSITNIIGKGSILLLGIISEYADVSQTDCTLIYIILFTLAALITLKELK